MIIGLALIAISFVFDLTAIPLLSQLNILWAIIIGTILIIAGFFFVKQAGPKHAKKEVPIYEGKGKKRKIVGYQRVK